MKVLTNFVRSGAQLEQPLFLPSGEFLPEGTVLNEETLSVLRLAGIKTLWIRPSEDIRVWETVPDLNAFMTQLSNRFTNASNDSSAQMIRCAVEDVYSRFLFDLETE